MIAQVGWFRYTRAKRGEGKRLLLMAPLHHHFEQKGWPETKVLARFWIIGLICAFAALLTLKLR